MAVFPTDLANIALQFSPTDEELKCWFDLHPRLTRRAVAMKIGASEAALYRWLGNKTRAPRWLRQKLWLEYGEPVIPHQGMTRVAQFIEWRWGKQPPGHDGTNV